MEIKNLSLDHIIRPAKKTIAFPPALLMFHGYGSNEEDLFAFAEQLPDDLVIISARAPHTIGYQSHAWYDITFDSEGVKTYNTDQAIDSRDGISNFIDQCCEAYHLDSNKISLLGFSQGAILSYAVGICYPEKIKNIIALSGFLDTRLLSEKHHSNDFSHLDIYASHGTEDEIISIELAKGVRQKLSELGINYSFEEFDAGHGVNANNFLSLKNWLSQRR